jgi:hypothetical protein
MKSIVIELDREVLAPGDLLRGRVLLSPPPGDERSRVELSVLWETSGDGAVDACAVALRVLADGDPTRAQTEHSFEIPLPLLPWTYRGTRLSIVWYVRVRRIHPTDDDTFVDREFEVRGPLVR